jgi:hypothetical protein
VFPASTPGSASGGGYVSAASGLGIVFGFHARNQSGTLTGHCNVIDVPARVHVRCLDVTAFARDGQRAFVYGNARVNGTPTRYRIEAFDAGEPGSGRDTFEILTESGYAAGGVITFGNVQVN